jgi:hypothetical protein
MLVMTQGSRMDSKAKLTALLKTAQAHPLSEKELRRLALPAYQSMVAGDAVSWAGLDCDICKAGTYMIGGDVARIDWVWVKLSKLLTGGAIGVFDASPSQYAAQMAFDKEKGFFESLGVTCRYISTSEKHPGPASGLMIDYGTAFVASMHELAQTNIAAMLGRSSVPRYHLCVRVLDALFDAGHASIALPRQAEAKNKWTNTLLAFIQSAIEPAWAMLCQKGWVDTAPSKTSARLISSEMCAWLDKQWDALPEEQAAIFKAERGRFLSLSSAYLYAKIHLQPGENYTVKDGVVKLIYGHGKAMQDADGLDDEVYAVLVARHGLAPRAESAVDTLHPVTWCAEQHSIVSGVVSPRVKRALSQDFGKKYHALKPNKELSSVTFCSGRAIQSVKISEALPDTQCPVIIVINDTSLRTAFAGLPAHVEILTHAELLTSLPYFDVSPLLIEIEPPAQSWCELFLPPMAEKLVRVWSDEDSRFGEGDALVWRHVITNAIVAERKASQVHKFLKGYYDRLLEIGISLYERGKLEGVVRARIRLHVASMLLSQQESIPYSLAAFLKLDSAAVNKVLDARSSHPDILQHLWLTQWSLLVGGEKAESVFDRLGTVLSQDLWDPERSKLMRLRGIWEVLNEKGA